MTLIASLYQRKVIILFMQIYTTKYHLNMKILKSRTPPVLINKLEVENCYMRFLLYPTDPVGTNDKNMTVLSEFLFVLVFYYYLH